MSESRQYKQLIDLGAARMEGNEDAALDARLLLEAVCGTNLQTLLLDPARPVSPKEEAEYMVLVERRRAHEPLAMILGEWDFMGLSFRVTKDVLIPEQDTEVLVEYALSWVDKTYGGKSADFRLLDMCTGSGCIGLSILHYLPANLNGTGIGCDISEAALAVARENAARLGLLDRMTFLQGDLFAPLGAQTFDMIVSNPPYIPRDVIPTLPEEVRLGEPYGALCGGEDGLDFYRSIVPKAGKRLRAGGMLLLEIGYDQGVSVPALLHAAGFDAVQVIKDYGGNDRVVVGIKKQT